MYTKPTKLQLMKHNGNNGCIFYTINKIWSGAGNVGYGQHKFMTTRDASDWANREYPNIPFSTQTL